MDAKKLFEVGGIVSDEPVKKVITWENEGGESFTFDVLIRQLSYGDFDRIQRMGIDHGSLERSANALLISESIVFDDGSKMTYEDAFQLKPTLAKAFLQAIGEAVAPKT